MFKRLLLQCVGVPLYMLMLAVISSVGMPLAPFFAFAIHAAVGYFLTIVIAHYLTVLVPVFRRSMFIALSIGGGAVCAFHPMFNIHWKGSVHWNETGRVLFGIGAFLSFWVWWAVPVIAWRIRFRTEELWERFKAVAGIS